MRVTAAGFAVLAGPTWAAPTKPDLAIYVQPANSRELHEGRISAAQCYWMRFMGADGLRDPDLTAISPARQAAKVDIPVLLIHGKDDTVVRYDQSQAMADALKKAGKPVAFVTLGRRGPLAVARRHPPEDAGRDHRLRRKAQPGRLTVTIG